MTITAEKIAEIRFQLANKISVTPEVANQLLFSIEVARTQRDNALNEIKKMKAHISSMQEFGL